MQQLPSGRFKGNHPAAAATTTAATATAIASNNNNSNDSRSNWARNNALTSSVTATTIKVV